MEKHLLSPGSLVGQYRIQSLLGSGGAGEVYLAEHPSQRHPVALKVLRSNPEAHSKALSRFRREARAASRVRHHHVAMILEFGTSTRGGAVGDIPYLAMEYAAGPTLEQHLKDHGVLSTRQALLILTQIASALEAAHACKVIHRDLKPGNVVLGHRRGQHWVKILDFGLAKILDPEETTGLTSTGSIIGTPLYMSPEQVAGDRVTLLTDIYSFGVLAYELVTGQPPFTGGLHQIMRAHVLQPVTPPSKVSGRHVVAALDRLVLDCLAKEPTRRLASASLLLARLRGLVAGNRPTLT